jgi:hypothetical protein
VWALAVRAAVEFHLEETQIQPKLKLGSSIIATNEADIYLPRLKSPSAERLGDIHLIEKIFGIQSILAAFHIANLLRAYCKPSSTGQAIFSNPRSFLVTVRASLHGS